MNLFDILSQDAFWQVNKKIAREVGLSAALLLSDLITKEHYFRARGELTADGYFYNTGANIETDTTLKRRLQRTAIDTLKKHGFISTILMGMPSKTHYRIEPSAIVKFLNSKGSENAKHVGTKTPNKIVQNVHSSLYENAKHVGTKTPTNKNKEIRINNKNKETNTEGELEVGFTFNEFWEAYDKKTGSKTKIEKKFKALNYETREAIRSHLKEYIPSTPEKRYRKDPATYLNNEGWTNEIISNLNLTQNEISKAKNRADADIYIAGILDGSIQV